LPSHPVGHSDLDLAVETTWPAQRGIDRLVPIRRADHDDLATAGEAVHQREELGDDPTLDLAGDLLTFRRDRVEFVDEQDARGVLLRLLEFLTKAFLALPVVLRHDLRALNRIEVRARLVRDGLRNEGLARPRRAIKEHALRRGADDHERQGTAHERNPRDDDDIALVQRPLQQAALHEVLDSLTEGDLVTLADDRRDRDPFRGQDLGLPDLDLVPEAHANIST